MKIKNSNKDKKQRNVKPPKAIKERWCECTSPRFNGDHIEPSCKVCGGVIG